MEVQINHTLKTDRLLPILLLLLLILLLLFLYRYYIDDCKALVFVVDSSDPARLPEAKKALKKVLADEKLRGIPLMVLANKKDLPNSMTIREVQRPALPTNNPTSSKANTNTDKQPMT